MPEGVRYFSINGTVGAIPTKNVDSFLKEYPQAKEQGKFILPDKSEGYIPFENINDFIKANPKAQADQYTYNNYKGWAQGQQAQQTIYSGIKPAPGPYKEPMFTGPAKPFVSTPEQPFQVPTPEDFAADKANYPKKLAQQKKQQLEDAMAFSPVYRNENDPAIFSGANKFVSEVSNDAKQSLASIAPQTFKFAAEGAKGIINSLESVSPYGDVNSDKAVKAPQKWLDNWSNYFSGELQGRQQQMSKNPTANLIGGLVPSAIQMGAVVAFPELAVPYMFGMGTQSGGSAMFQYEQKQKELGLPINDDVKLGIGLLNATIETATEGLGTATRYTKGLIKNIAKQKVVENAIANPNQVATIFKNFIAKHPTEGRLLWESIKHGALQANEEGMEEVLSTLVQATVNKLLYDDQAFKDIKTNVVQSYLGGSVLGSIFSGMASKMYSNTVHQSIQNDGSATFGVTKKGDVFHIINEDGKTFNGINEYGIPVEKNKNDLAYITELTKEEYDNFENTVNENGTPATPEQQFRQQFEQEAAPTIHEDGFIHIAKKAGQEENPVYVVSGNEKSTDPDEQLIIYNPTTGQRELVTPKVLITSENDPVNPEQAFQEQWQAVQAQQEAQNQPAPQVPERITVGDKQYIVTDQSDIANGITVQQYGGKDAQGNDILGKPDFIIADNYPNIKEFNAETGTFGQQSVTDSNQLSSNTEQLNGQPSPDNGQLATNEGQLKQQQPARKTFTEKVGKTDHTIAVNEDGTLEVQSDFKTDKEAKTALKAFSDVLDYNFRIQTVKGKPEEIYTDELGIRRKKPAIPDTFRIIGVPPMVANKTGIPISDIPLPSEKRVSDLEQRIAKQAEAGPVTEAKVPQRKVFWQPSKEALQHGNVEPMTPEEAVLQFFVKGGKIATKDFKELTGWGIGGDAHGQTELKEYRWLHDESGVPVDELSNIIDTPMLTSYIEQYGTNAIQNVVQSAIMDYDSRKSMLDKLKAMHNTEGASEEEQKRAEENGKFQDMLEKQAEDELYNDILSNLVETYGEPPVELFQDENTQGNNEGVSGSADNGVHAEVRNDPAGSIESDKGTVGRGTEEVTPALRTQNATLNEPTVAENAQGDTQTGITEPPISENVPEQVSQNEAPVESAPEQAQNIPVEQPPQPETQGIENNDVATGQPEPVAPAVNEQVTGEGDAKQPVKTSQVISNMIRRDVFREIVSQSIQKDGQNVIDAYYANDIDLLQKIIEKYSKDQGRLEGGGGAGPGKVKQARRGASTVYEAARIALNDIKTKPTTNETQTKTTQRETETGLLEIGSDVTYQGKPYKVSSISTDTNTGDKTYDIEDTDGNTIEDLTEGELFGNTEQPATADKVATVKPQDIYKQLEADNKYTVPKVPTQNVFKNEVSQPAIEARVDADKFVDKLNELPVESVNVSDIIPTQKNLTIPNLKSTKGIKEPAYLVKYNGKYYVIDGHHRIANGILNGEKSVDAYVYDTETQTLPEDAEPVSETPEPAKPRFAGDVLKETNDTILKHRTSKLDREIDSEYFKALEENNIERANELVLEQARRSGYISDNDYRMSHRAPSYEPGTPQERMDDGFDMNVSDIAQGYSNQPDDYFDDKNGARWYGYNDYSGRQAASALKSAMRNIRGQIAEYGEIKDMPKITVYRAVPKTLKEGSIRNGDWVTPSENYAINHGKSYIDSGYTIMKQEIPADQLWWDGNDIREWGVDDGNNYAYQNTKNNKKLLDTITRDENGEIIPLSKRFNKREESILKHRFAGDVLNEILKHSAYHGSPHNFDKFSLDKIGTGEGAQAYGWGLYFTDKKGVAEQYAKMGHYSIGNLKIKNLNLYKNTVPYNYNSNIDGQHEAAIIEDLFINEFAIKNGFEKSFADGYKAIQDIFDEMVEEAESEKEYDKKYFKDRMKVIKRMRPNKESDVKLTPDVSRNLYQVSLHDGKSPDEYDYLRWDKPVTKTQAGKIKDAIYEKYGNVKNKSESDKFNKINTDITRATSNNNPTNKGSYVYTYLSDLLGSDKEASLFLLRSGIDGIKYPAEYLSKGTHEDAFNYVVFDENAVKIEDHILFHIIGQQGAKAIEGLTDNLNVAKQMTEAGKDAKTIFLATGWEKFPDGWKYDLPDIINTDIIDERTEGQYSNSFEAEELLNKDIMKAYPNFNRMYIDISVNPTKNDNSGSYTPFQSRSSEGLFDVLPEIKIKATTTEMAKSVLVHEIQHAIQDIEGFAEGGSPRQFYNGQSAKDIADEINRNYRFDVWQIEHSRAYITKKESLVSSADKTKQGWLGDIESQLREEFGINKLDDKRAIDVDEALRGIFAVKKYQRLAGEVEARNAQTRLNLTPEQRKQQMLSETDDVAEDQKIYLQNAIGKAYSMEAKPATDQITGKANEIMSTVKYKTPLLVVETANELRSWYKNNNASAKHMAQIEEMINDPGCDGVFDPVYKQIVIVAPRINTLQQVESTVQHESVHATNRGFLSTRREDILQFFHDEYGYDNVFDYLSSGYSHFSEVNRADEVIAYRVQEMFDNNITPTEKPYSYREIVDIVEGNAKSDNFTERLISTIYYETSNNAHRWPDTGKPGLSDNAGREMGGTGTDTQGEPNAQPMGMQKNSNSPKPRFIGDYLKEGSLGLLKSVIRTDQYGKQIVWEDNGYSVSVDNADNAKYVALWKDGKKVGELFTTPGRNFQTKGYLSVQNVTIDKKHQGKGLSKQLYNALLDHLGSQYKGISSENEQRSNKKQVPSIWKKLGAKEVDGNFTVDKQLPATITINGTPRPTTNSKGQPIHSTIEGIKNFWKWFGDSKVTDEQGRPLVVYHGTASDFDIFNKEKQNFDQSTLGYYFTSGAIANTSKGIYYGSTASEYAQNAQKTGYAELDGANIVPVYLSIQKPILVNADGWYSSNTAIDKQRSELEREKSYGKSDGIISEYKDIDEGGNEKIYVVYSNNQIKSATGNSGNFSPDDPSILKHSNTPPAEPPTNPPRFAGDALKGDGGKRAKGTHGNYSERIKYIATDKDMRENFLHNPVQFAKDFPKYIHELVRKPLLSVELMERDLKTDDLSRPSDAFVKVNAQANGYIHEFETKVLPDIIQAYSDIYKNSKLNQDEIGEYIYSKASVQRTDVEGKPAFSEDPRDEWNRYKCENTIKEFESKVPKALVDNLWDAIKKATDYKVETWLRTGRIDSDEAFEYRSRKYYVPLKGWDENPDDFYDYKTKNYGSGNTIHKAVQRHTRPEGNPIEQIVYDIQNAIKAGQKNLAIQHVIRLAQNNPDKDNILNLQETWLVKEGNLWTETGERPDEELFRQTKEARRKVAGLTLARAAAVQRLRVAQSNGSSLIKLSSIQDQIEALDEAITLAGEEVVVRTVPNNSNYDHRTDAQAQQHQVKGYMNGKSYTVHFNDPNVASALKGENLIRSIDAYGKAGQMVSRLTVAWQQNVTGKAVNFFLPNTIRDVQAAAQRHALMPRGNAKLFIQYYPTAEAITHRYITGKANPVYNELGDPKSPKYNPSAMTKEQQQNYWDWFMDTMVKAGARSGYVHMGDLAKTRKEIRKVIKAATTGRNPLEAIKYYAWHKPGTLLEWGGVMSEDPTRIATAITTHLQGYSDELASTDAKEITVNFDRGSRIKGVLSPIFAFIQARVEGTANHMSQWKHNPKGAAKAAALWMIAGALITEALRHLMDDEEKKKFDNLPDYVKYGYYVIPKSIFGMESGLIRIPLPHGFSAYFAIGRILDDLGRGFISPQEAATNTLASTFNAFTPVNVDGNDVSRSFVPALGVPIWDAEVTNKDFAGRSVSRQYATEKEKDFTPNTNMGLKDVSAPFLWVTRFMNDAAGGDWKNGIAPQYEIDEQGRFTKKTGPKLWFANAMDWNPSKLEHAFVYYAGGRGELYTQTYKLANAVLKGEEVRPQYIPIASRFTLSNGSGDMQDDYYKLKKQLDIQVKQRSISKSKGNDALRDLQKQDTDMTKLLTKYRLTEQRIKHFNEFINDENSSQETIDKYKAKRKDAIEKFMNYYNAK